MIDKEILCYFILFVLGWLIYRMIGDGFSVGGIGGYCGACENSVYPYCKKGACSDGGNYYTSLLS